MVKHRELIHQLLFDRKADVLVLLFVEKSHKAEDMDSGSGVGTDMKASRPSVS
jgi:hypothetical protein